MATKTISLEVDAYDRLRSAKRNARGSFSSVVRRARWDDVAPAAGEILKNLQLAVRDRPDLLLSEAELDRLARRRRPTRPRTRWQER